MENPVWNSLIVLYQQLQELGTDPRVLQLVTACRLGEEEWMPYGEFSWSWMSSEPKKVMKVAVSPAGLPDKNSNDPPGRLLFPGRALSPG